MSESKKIVVQFDGYEETLDAEDVYNFYGCLGDIEYVTFKNCKALVEGKWIISTYKYLKDNNNKTITKEIFIDALRVLNLKGNHPDESYSDYLEEEIREFEMQYCEEKNIEDDPSDRYDSQREEEDYTEYMERMNHG
jgi:hypothetical protein